MHNTTTNEPDDATTTTTITATETVDNRLGGLGTHVPWRMDGRRWMDVSMYPCMLRTDNGLLLAGTDYDDQFLVLRTLTESTAQRG